MNENYQSYQPETPALQKPKIPKTAWFIGGGCLILICCAAIASLAAAGYLYFGNADPIASAVPGSAMMYMKFDFLQAQSDQFNETVSIFQGIAGEEKKPLVDLMEEQMQEDLGLSFKSEVMPWMGRNGAFAVTGGDVQSGDFEFMFIMETRNKKLADEFIGKFVAAMEDKNDMKFEQKVVDGVTFHVYRAGYGEYNDMIIARDGSLLYLANAEDPVVSSINLKSADSLAKSQAYKDALSALPAKGMATLYASEQFMAAAMEEAGSEFSAPGAGFQTDIMSGMGVGASLVEEGLRFDIAVVYNEEKLSDYQKETLKAKHADPTTDKLLPEDTFLFIGANSSQPPSSALQEGNPAYTQDMKEALELFEKQYNLSVQDLLDLLSGEFAIAAGPAKDGLLPAQGDINLGVTLLAGTKDEQGFEDWTKNALDVLSDNGLQVDVKDFSTGGYNLHQASAQGVGDVLVYGAGKGYIFLGTSREILEKGLSGSASLADNPVYRDTWKAFPASSAPYLYANLSGMYDLYESAPGGDLGEAETDLRKIPVVAAVVNPTDGNVVSVTIVAFINTK